MAANYTSLGQILGGPSYAIGTGLGIAKGGPNKAFINSDFYKNQVDPWSKLFNQYSGYMDYQKQRQDIATQNPKASPKQLEALYRQTPGLAMGVKKYGTMVVPQQLQDYMGGKYANDPIATYAKALYDQNKVANGLSGGGNEESYFDTLSRQQNALSGQPNINDLMLKAYTSTLDPTTQKVLSQQVAGKGYGKKLGYDNRANTQALINELNTLSGQGYNIKNASGNTAKQIQRLAPDLARYGVKSLNDLSSVKMMNPYTGKEESVFYNKTTGTLLPTEFGSSMKGEGGSYFKLHDYNGRVLPISNWKDTSEAADYAPLAMMASMMLGPALGPLASSLGGSLAGATGMSTGLATGLTQAGLSGLAQGALTSAMGGNFGQGFLGGALGSGISSGINSLGFGNSVANSLAPLGNTAGEAALNSAISGGVDSALAKGLTGGLMARIGGGDIGKGALSGALSGGISGGLGGYLQGMGADSTLANLAGGQLGKLASSSLFSPNSGTNNRGQSGELSQAQAAQQNALAKRQYHLSNLPQYAQDRVQGGLNRLRGYGANFDDVEFV